MRVLVTDPNAELLLPARTRLLHIGPMKTGTSSIQAAASSRREKLLAHGVRYPGRWFNHRRQLGALMGWSVDTWRRSGPLRPDLLDVDKSGVPPHELWEELHAEISADHDRRIFLTHEFVSQVDDETAKRVLDGIGGPVHVCVTLRAPGQIVPSLWAQGVRDDAQTEPYPGWLASFYGKDPQRPLADRYRRAYDQAELVARWTGLVGPKNVTVVIVDPSAPNRLTDTFESMLGLPAGMLAWGRSNRSLTAPEAELFRRVNVELDERGADWRSQYDLIWKGAVQHGTQPRKPGPDEARMLLPEWAARIAEEDGRAFADRIAQSDVRVVGNLDDLAAPSPRADWPEMDTIPLDIAVPALAAAVLAAQQGRRKAARQSRRDGAELDRLRRQAAEHTCPTFAQQVRSIPADQRAERLASTFSTRELAAALKRRLLYKLRTRRSHPTDGRKVKAAATGRRR